ncbi:MAG: transposase [Nitrososphaerota archaeon]|nr:transposase [Nitrososphaerota archaeon]
MTTHRRWSAEEKFAIVMEGLQPDANVAAICRRHGISSTLFYSWKEKGLENLKASLRSRESNVETSLKHENTRLRKLVADLTIANDVLKEYVEGKGKNNGGRS